MILAERGANARRYCPLFSLPLKRKALTLSLQAYYRLQRAYRPACTRPYKGTRRRETVDEERE
jgi:hypothetical protein